MKGTVAIGKQEWNKAEDYNTALFCLDFAIHDLRHNIKTTKNKAIREDAFAEFHSLLEEVVDALIDSKRFEMYRINQLQEDIDKCRDSRDYFKLRDIHRAIKRDFFRPMNVMDYTAMRIGKDEVMSQAMK